MYAKLFTSIYQGTLRGNSNGILVFTNMLAHCDKHGICDIHPRAIAEEVGLSQEAVRAAILELEAPDDESRSPEEEGRRIVRMDDHRAWGWRVVNYLKYRAIRDEDDRREQNRLAQEAWRLRKQNKPASATVSPDQPIQRQKQKQEAEEEKKDPPLAGASDPPLKPVSGLKVASGLNLEPDPEDPNKLQEPVTINLASGKIRQATAEECAALDRSLAKTRKAAAVPAKPDDVEQQVWDDWLAHRRKKQATVSPTVLDGARDEAAKAGIDLNAFLKIWCTRGTQGLKAEWLTAEERGVRGRAIHEVEPEWRRKQRERTEAFIGKPSAKQPINMGEIFDVTATKLG